MSHVVRLFTYAKAAALAAAFCFVVVVLPAAAKDFTDTDVTEEVKKVIADRSADGAFVFHDPKAMAGSPMSSSTTRKSPRSSMPSTSGSGPRATLTLMDIRVQKGPKRDGDNYHTFAHRMVVASRAGTSGRHGGDPRVACDERDPQLHRRE